MVGIGVLFTGDSALNLNKLQQLQTQRIKGKEFEKCSHDDEEICLYPPGGRAVASLLWGTDCERSLQNYQLSISHLDI